MARVEAAPTEVEHPHRQTRLRVLTGALALVFVVAAVVLVTHHQRVRPSVPAYCAQMRVSQDLSNVMATGDADQITRAVAQLDRAVAVAPEPVLAPTRVLVAYADGLASSLRSGGDTDAALAAAVRRQAPQIPRVQAAGRQVAAWVQANCSLTLAP